MNLTYINQAFTAIIEKKDQLNALSKNNKEYSRLESEYRGLIDKFMSDYGSFIEEALFNVHDEYCPDNDVMQPLAYMATEYLRKNDSRVAPQNEGLEVHCDDYPDLKTRLVLEPGPLKLVIQAENADFREVVWVAR